MELSVSTEGKDAPAVLLTTFTIDGRPEDYETTSFLGIKNTTATSGHGICE
jgi:hypothetical protein